MPFYIVASLRAKSDEAATALAKHLATVRDEVHANEPGTLMYHPCRDEADPLSFSVLEEYADAAAQENASAALAKMVDATEHREGKAYNVFKAELPSLAEGGIKLQKLSKV